MPLTAISSIETVQPQHEHDEGDRRQGEQNGEEHQGDSKGRVRSANVRAEILFEPRQLKRVEQFRARPLADERLHGNPLFLFRRVEPHSSLPKRRASTTRPAMTSRPDTVK